MGRCGRGGTGRRIGLKPLSALGETSGAELLKVGETFTGNPEPSPRPGEGVETRRAAPTADQRQGEGIVQTTNAGWAAAKAEVVRKSVGPQGLCRFESGRPHQIPAMAGAIQAASNASAFPKRYSSPMTSTSSTAVDPNLKAAGVRETFDCELSPFRRKIGRRRRGAFRA